MKSNVWTLYEQLGEKDRWSLTGVLRAAFAICDFRQEVNSGGFDAYFRYWGGNTAPEALAAMADVLGNEWAALLGEAVAALGPTYPTDPDARAELIDQNHLEDHLNQLDLRLCDLEGSDDADRRLNAYLARGAS